MIDKNNIYKNMVRLISVPSISGTEGENVMAQEIAELLREIPYFAGKKDAVRLVPLENDPLGRQIVTAFWQCEPKSEKTVILTGHYDIVDVEEFGHLKDKAFDVEAITKCINEMPLDADSKKDFASGEWLFGRGTADMKYGHALCMELLKHYSEEGGIDGNLLYVAVCGEETNSEGMLRAVSFFNEFAAEKEIKYSALLLAECYMMEDQANDRNRYIHFGASGKIMPMYFFVGEATHAGEPFLGLDPNLMAMEVYRLMHLNATFCQSNRGETTPPPVCLKTQDLKTLYSASTPLYSASYYNIVTLDLDPEKIIEELSAVGEQAFRNTLRFMQKRQQEYQQVSGTRPVTYPVEPCVKTFRQLYEDVAAAFDGNLDDHIQAAADKWLTEKIEIQEIAIRIVKMVYELYQAKRPMIIVSVIPPYYPDTYPDTEDASVKHLLECVNKIIEYAETNYGETLKLKNYYMGISDMCYTGLTKGKNFDRFFENVAGIDKVYSLPREALKKFCVPGIVLGGYGKDFHKYTERLHIRYNFDVLPDLYEKIIRLILE